MYGTGILLKNKEEIPHTCKASLNVIKLAVLKLICKFSTIPNQNANKISFLEPKQPSKIHLEGKMQKMAKKTQKEKANKMGLSITY